MTSYSSEKIFSIDDNRECITEFFRYVDEEVQHVQSSSKTILFHIDDDINWLVTLGKGAEYVLARSADKFAADCLITTDSYCMAKLARGILKPMSAIMGGHLKLDGDTNIFGELSSTLKLAVKAMMEHNKQHFSLDVSINRTFERSGRTDGGDKYTLYIIRSVDRIGGNYWHTPHRYSDFVSFRKILEQRGYKMLPQLPRKHLRSSVDPKIVRRRVEDLALFLQLVIIQVGSHEEAVIHFLKAYPRGGETTSAGLVIDACEITSDRGSEAGDYSDELLTDSGITQRRKHALLTAQHHAASSIKLYGPRIRCGVCSDSLRRDISPRPRSSVQSALHEDTTGAIGHTATLREAAALESYGPTGVYDHFEKQRVIAIREEVFRLRRRLEAAERSAGRPPASANASGVNFRYNEEASLTAQMAGVFLYLLPRVTLWGTIIVLVVGISLPMLLNSTDVFVGTLTSLLNCDITPLTIPSVTDVILRTSAVVSGLVLPLFLWLVFFAFFTFVCSASYTRAPAAFSLFIYLLTPIVTSAYSAMNASLLESVFGSQTCTLELDITGERCLHSPLLILMDGLLWLGRELLSSRGFGLIVFSWLFSSYVNYCLVQFKFLGRQFSSSPLLLSCLSTLQSVERMFTIYTPTATVVSAYLHLIVILGMFGCTKRVASDSSSAKDYLDSKNESRNLYSSSFDALDRVLADYVLAEVRSLKSVFLKIGQYVAGRPDLVSGLWAESLKCLLDNCPVSSELYVRQTVEACLSAASHKEDRANGKRRGKLVKRLEDFFESFDMRPLQSGCVAQTHRATMRLDGGLVEVRVKVQHPAVEAALLTDIAAGLFVVGAAAAFHPKWKALLSLLEVWKLSLLEELDFRIEAKRLMQSRYDMDEAGFGLCTPVPIKGYVHRRVMVTTCLPGFKITDDFALSLHGVDKESLLCRLAHSLAYQILVAGFFNADPHPGNVLCVEAVPKELGGDGNCSHESKSADLPLIADEMWHPGLQDYGLTASLKDDTRIWYCSLLISLQEEDIQGVTTALKALGYVNKQSDRAPERDQEFFEFMFRDANDLRTSHAERKLFNDMRNAQLTEDMASGLLDSSERSILSLPVEYFYLSRTVGLLRGLAALMGVRCPIMEIFTLQARVGICQRNDDS